MYGVAMAKKPINLTVDPELLEQARALNLNLSQLFEDSLKKAVSDKQREQWRAEIRESVAAYNRYVERYGVFSDGKRLF